MKWVIAMIIIRRIRIKRIIRIILRGTLIIIKVILIIIVIGAIGTIVMKRGRITKIITIIMTIIKREII